MTYSSIRSSADSSWPLSISLRAHLAAFICNSVKWSLLHCFFSPSFPTLMPLSLLRYLRQAGFLPFTTFATLGLPAVGSNGNCRGPPYASCHFSSFFCFAGLAHAFSRFSSLPACFATVPQALLPFSADSTRTLLTKSFLTAGVDVPYLAVCRACLSALLFVLGVPGGLGGLPLFLAGTSGSAGLTGVTGLPALRPLRTC